MSSSSDSEEDDRDGRMRNNVWFGNVDNRGHLDEDYMNEEEVPGGEAGLHRNLSSPSSAGEDDDGAAETKEEEKEGDEEEDNVNITHAENILEEKDADGDDFDEDFDADGGEQLEQEEIPPEVKPEVSEKKQVKEKKGKEGKMKVDNVSDRTEIIRFTDLYLSDSAADDPTAYCGRRPCLNESRLLDDVFEEDVDEESAFYTTFSDVDSGCEADIECVHDKEVRSVEEQLHPPVMLLEWEKNILWNRNSRSDVEERKATDAQLSFVNRNEWEKSIHWHKDQKYPYRSLFFDTNEKGIAIFTQDNLQSALGRVPKNPLSARNLQHKEYSRRREIIKKDCAERVIHPQCALNLRPPFFSSVYTQEYFHSLHHPKTGSVLGRQWPRSVVLEALSKRSTPNRPVRDYLAKHITSTTGRSVVIEHIDERPPLLSVTSMCTRIENFYYQKDRSDDVPSMPDGNTRGVDSERRLPFLTEMKKGDVSTLLMTNMCDTEIVPQQLNDTDFLLIWPRKRNNSGKETMYIREIDTAFTACHQQPLRQGQGCRGGGVIPAYGDRSRLRFDRARTFALLYRSFSEEHSDTGSTLVGDYGEILRKLPDVEERTIKRCLSDECEVTRDGKVIWRQDREFPSKERIQSVLTPEDSCKYQSMMAGYFHLRVLDIEREACATSFLSSLAQVCENQLSEDDLRAIIMIQSELKQTPWAYSNTVINISTQSSDMRFSEIPFISREDLIEAQKRFADRADIRPELARRHLMAKGYTDGEVKDMTPHERVFELRKMIGEGYQVGCRAANYRTVLFETLKHVLGKEAKMMRAEASFSESESEDELEDFEHLGDILDESEEEDDASVRPESTVAGESDSDTVSVASTTLLSARGDEESAGRRVVLRKRWTAADGSSKQMLITDPEEVRKIQIRQQKLEILRGLLSKADIDFEDAGLIRADVPELSKVSKKRRRKNEARMYRRDGRYGMSVATKVRLPANKVARSGFEHQRNVLRIPKADPKRRKTVHVFTTSTQKHLSSVIKEVMECGRFLNFIGDPLIQLAPEEQEQYKSMNSNIIFLEMIKERNDRGAYNTVDDFMKDISILAENARRFCRGRYDFVCSLVDELLKTINKMVAKIRRRVKR